MIETIESAEVVSEVAAIEAEIPTTTEQDVEVGQPETVVAEASENSEEPQDVAAEVEHIDAPDEETLIAEADVQNAAVYVTTSTMTQETISMYDTETGTSVTDTSIRDVRVEERIEDATIEVAAAEEPSDEEETVAEVSEPEGVVAEEAHTDEAPAIQVDYAQVIAELQAALNDLRNELADIRNERIVAEAKKADEAANAINPFIAEISAPKKYSLLESERDSSVKSYSLLEKA